MIDLGPTARQVADLLTRVPDEQLTAPTPCAGTSVGDLVDHVSTLALAFQAAARKEAGVVTGPPPRPDAARLDPDWRRTVPDRVLALALAWREPAAWQGMTQAGGLDLPGEVAGVVALDELVLHGWDLARATGQPYDCTPEAVAACTAFVASMAAPEHEEARQGLFGPVVPVPDGATPFERLLCLSGRDPAWTPAQVAGADESGAPPASAGENRNRPPQEPPMDRMIFVNLPVRDVRASRSFWSQLGFGFNEQFSDATTACLVLGEGIHAMLLEEARFADFSPLPIADAFATKEVLTCLTCRDRGEVDDLVAKAVAAGAKPWKETFEHGPMYGGSFQDVDGHVWELMSTDAPAADQG